MELLLHIESKKDKLNARLIEIQERFAKVLDKCGPGANKDITKDESKSELTGFQRTNDLFQPSFGPGGLGRKLKLLSLKMEKIPLNCGGFTICTILNRGKPQFPSTHCLFINHKCLLKSFYFLFNESWNVFVPILILEFNA